MELRADPSDSSETTAASGASALAGLPSYWDVAKRTPKIDWEKWWDLFVMAVNAKYSISVPELRRTATEQQPRQAALINNLNEQAAEIKIVSVLFLSLGSVEEKPHRQVPIHGCSSSNIEGNAGKLRTDVCETA